MSFSNLTQRNEIKAILGSVFNQPPNLDIRFNSCILFLEIFSVLKPLLQLPLVLMFNWSSYLSSLVDWFQNCQKYISRNCLITTQVRLVLCVWNDQIFHGGTQQCFAIIIFVKVAASKDNEVSMEHRVNRILVFPKKQCAFVFKANSWQLYRALLCTCGREKRSSNCLLCNKSECLPARYLHICLVERWWKQVLFAQFVDTWIQSGK